MTVCLPDQLQAEPLAAPCVLVAERDPLLATRLAAQLRQLGLCPLLPAPTAAATLACCRHHPPELALVDPGLLADDSSDPATAELTALLSQLPLLYLADAPDEVLPLPLRATRPLALLPRDCPPEELRRAVLRGLAAGSDELPLAPPSAVAPPPPPPAGLFVRERGALVRVAVADIASVGMEQQYAVLTLVSGRRYPLRLTLAEVLACLPASEFVQCHRAWVVGLRHVEQVELTGDRVRLAGGMVAALGRAYRQHLLAHLQILG